MILHDQSLLPTAPSVPVGTTWTIIEDTTWEVLATGSYQIEMHGGGGGAARIRGSSFGQSVTILSSGGGSGELYVQNLTKGEKIQAVIGAGGQRENTSFVLASITGGTGGTTTFGTLSLAGGGGERAVSGGTSSGGDASGSLANPGATLASKGMARGGYGNWRNESQPYGNGGDAVSDMAFDGNPGAIIITYLG